MWPNGVTDVVLCGDERGVAPDARLSASFTTIGLAADFGVFSTSLCDQ